MVDIAYGPGPDRKTGSRTSDRTEAYLDMVRRRRLYSGIILALFVALMIAGFRLAESRNAGGFLNGLPQLFAFPS